ncbi:MAG: DUF177 domain-containing protein [Elusimicrobiota bacterium]
MKVSLKELIEQQELFLNYSEIIPGEELAGLAQVKAVHPIQVSLRMSEQSGEILGQGEIDLKVDFCCSNCLTVFPVEIKLPWQFLIAVKEITGREIDLTPEINQIVFLNLPDFPRCRPDCRGLCPKCGENLNQGRCSCSSQEKNSPFDVLNKFKLKREKNAKS